MIAQPTSTTTPSNTELEQEVLLLRSALNDALTRIGNLERTVSFFSSQAGDSIRAARQLVTRDSPEMSFGLQLCQETFPGCTVEVDVESDPSEPSWPWYTLTIHWRGEVRDCVDREMVWHEKLAAQFPHVLDQFRLFVDLQ